MDIEDAVEDREVIMADAVVIEEGVDEEVGEVEGGEGELEVEG